MRPVVLVRRAVLPAPPEDVWAVLVDWDGQARWMPDVAWIRALGSERELGARFAVRTRVFGIPAVTDLVEVTAWEPPRRLAVEHRGLVRGRGEWVLEPLSGGRTRFAWREELSMPPPGLGDLAVRAYAPVQEWLLGRSVARLRRLVAAGRLGDAPA